MYQEIELISKRNKVLRIKHNTKTYIRKIFSDEKSFNKELEIMSFLQLNSTHVPKIIEVGDNEITYEDLGDVTLLHWLESKENEGTMEYDDLINNLISSLNELYSLLRMEFKEELVLFDMNFRNFILSGGNIYRVDFEQVKTGSRDSDLGKLLAFLINYHPENSKWKREFRDSIIEALKKDNTFNVNEILRYELEEIERMKIRRNKG